MPDLLERLKSAVGNRYTVESKIGRGGMATVFLAEDLKHRRQVAIKVLHPELAASLGTTRFLREIETVARLDHPHVLALYDSGEADGLLFYVMPYVEGESLQERLQREGQLPIDQALSIAAEVADGLAYAHERGVVHRDIKPGNTLGRPAEAVTAGQRAVDLMPLERDALLGTRHLQYLAHVHALVGEHDTAIDQLELLLSIPGPLSVANLRIDPTWDALREHPRFQALVGDG